MRWAGVGMAFGIILLVVGGLVIAGGIAVSVVGPGAVDDWERGEGDGNDPGGERNGLLGLDGEEGGEEEERRGTRQEVRAVGVLVMGAGAVCAFLGGVLYAVSRGAEANRRAREDVEPPKKQMPLT